MLLLTAASGAWAQEPEITVNEVSPVTVPGATKQWTFEMLGSDVELTPIYAPAAAWAVDNNSVEQKPTAVEGVIAGTEEFIVNPGIVADEDDVPQGDVRYYVTSDATFTKAQAEALAEDKWGQTPTAKELTPGTYYVWYFISGADTPDDEAPTAQNTFNDSEICETPVEVNISSDKFDIIFNAANANTIEAGKATVTVDGTEATPDKNGWVRDVKAGSEVKVKAKSGYKFKKATARKQNMM